MQLLPLEKFNDTLGTNHDTDSLIKRGCYKITFQHIRCKTVSRSGNNNDAIKTFWFVEYIHYKLCFRLRLRYTNTYQTQLSNIFIKTLHINQWSCIRYLKYCHKLHGVNCSPVIVIVLNNSLCTYLFWCCFCDYWCCIFLHLWYI